jgi:hypothetical protein
MSVDRGKLEWAARAVAETLNDCLPDMLGDRVGFVVMLSEFESGGYLAYVSNINREDMIKLVKEWLARAESGLMTDAPGARAKT